jgi:hypothetical protein
MIYDGYWTPIDVVQNPAMNAPVLGAFRGGPTYNCGVGEEASKYHDDVIDAVLTSS